MAPAADGSAGGTPLSLKPFPVADKKPQNVAEFIARVNAQPGGFRALSAAKLREDADRKQAHGDEIPDDDEDVSMSDADDGEDDDDDDDDADPQQARIDVLRSIDTAANTALLTLDTMSLLLSKQNPTQAGATLSKHLREVAGIGTLGTDRLAESNVPEAKEKEQASVALGWTIMEVDKMKSLAEEASSFLQDEIDSENRYWEDVIGVQSSGWSICKMPQERHTLGVRFGFSEAAPEYRSMGLAPMRRAEDGSVNLDNGALGGQSERFIVSYEKDGKVIGRSTIEPQLGQDAPLEARVLEARNTLFAQELWHEISREARTLAAYKVRPEGSSLVYKVDDTTRVTAELLSLDRAPAPDASLPNNDTAEAISLTLHILLSYAHRHNELMRMRPLPPHFPRARGQVSYALLRPVIGHFTYLKNIESSTAFTGGLIKTLKKAGLDSSFTLRTSRHSLLDAPLQTGGPHHLSAAQVLVRNMLQPSDFTITLTLLPNMTITIRGRTPLYPVTATYYHILLPPESPLETTCPPHKDGYTDVPSLAEYLAAATERLLTEHFLAKLPAGEWGRSVQGNAIERVDRSSWQCRFQVRTEPAKEGNATGNETPPPVLAVYRHTLVDGKAEARTFRWAGNEEDAAPMTLEKAMDDVINSVSQ